MNPLKTGMIPQLLPQAVICRGPVTEAFAMVLDEIEAISAGIARRGAEAFRSRDYEAALELGAKGASLEVYRSRVMALASEWSGSPLPSTAPKLVVLPAPDVPIDSAPPRLGVDPVIAVV